MLEKHLVEEACDRIHGQLKLVEQELAALKADKKLLETLLLQERELVDDWRQMALVWAMKYEQLQDEYDLFREEAGR